MRTPYYSLLGFPVKLATWEMRLKKAIPEKKRSATWGVNTEPKHEKRIGLKHFIKFWFTVASHPCDLRSPPTGAVRSAIEQDRESPREVGCERIKFAVNPPTPRPNWQAPVSTRNLAGNHGARGGVCNVKLVATQQRDSARSSVIEIRFSLRIIRRSTLLVGRAHLPIGAVMVTDLA